MFNDYQEIEDLDEEAEDREFERAWKLSCLLEGLAAIIFILAVVLFVF